MMISPDFARRLERERDEAREQIQSIHKHDQRRLESDSIVGSCDCLTKTPEVKYHKPGCKYRILSERDEAREQLEWLWSNCKIVHWPKRQGAYPIEHAPAANKCGRWLIEAEMAGKPIGSQSPSLQLSKSDPTPPNPAASSPDPGE